MSSFLEMLFGKLPKLGSKIESPNGKMTTVKKDKKGLYIMYTDSTGKKRRKSLKETKKPKKETKKPKKETKKPKSPKSKTTMSDTALRKLAKQNNVSVYKVQKKINKKTGEPIKKKELVSRSTLLKRLREAGVYISNKKSKVDDDFLVDPSSDEDSEVDNEEFLVDPSGDEDEEPEDEFSMVFGKRKGNPDAKKAMRLMYKKGISLKQAWKEVKAKKAKSPKKAKKAKSPKKAKKAKSPKKAKKTKKPMKLIKIRK